MSSGENRQRPVDEVRDPMGPAKTFIRRGLTELRAAGGRARVIGEVCVWLGAVAALHSVVPHAGWGGSHVGDSFAA